MIELFIKTALELDDKTLARCKELSYGDDGYMCEDIDRIRATEPIKHRPSYRLSHVCLAYYNGKLVGWSLLEPRPRSPRWVVQLFVDPKYRGKGVGTKLLHQANAWSMWKHRPIAYVDPENCGFFAKHPSLFTEV